MSHTTDTKQDQPRSTETEADVKRTGADTGEKSSHDATSRIKAGKDEGAGGGAKQQQQHR